MASRRSAVATCLATVLLTTLLAVPALADFGDPGTTSPSESPRENTPNDPEFDRCEADDEDAPQETCGSYFEEQFGSFGFNPDSARDLLGQRTSYREFPPGSGNCPQLDEQGKEANRDAGDPECSQLSGVRADTAWKYSTGSPETVIAILDTGIEWQTEELVEKVALNTGELPLPGTGRDTPLLGAKECNEFDGTGYDANGDGAVNVTDYACDPDVEIDAGDTESDELLDPSDLIATFSEDLDSDGDPDDDGNGYADDIAGWDFFDDDNDPFDASSCCSAEGHGSGRALEAAAETNNGVDETGMCPDCQVMPLRVWDTFVVDTNLFSLGLVYAADNGAAVAEGAVGGLLNSRFARSAFEYADQRGMALTMVSSDINSANHNYPTNYNEAMYVAGSLPDTAPFGACNGPGGLPGIGSFPVSPPAQFTAGCNAFLTQLGTATGCPGTN
ncbi:MAG: S8 family serine peptidase, partial [Thermoleophilaceae bacterium]